MSIIVILVALVFVALLLFGLVVLGLGLFLWGVILTKAVVRVWDFFHKKEIVIGD